MTFNQIKQLWISSIQELLDVNFPEEVINCLSYQMIDSISRVNIFKIYLERARKAESETLSYFHTSNPFTLAQRSSLTLETRVWHSYVATYFGKSNSSKWNLFYKATFRDDNSLITLEYILGNKDEYFNYLRSLNFFGNGNFSNHRKYTKKSLDGEKGVLSSFNFVLDNIHLYVTGTIVPFDEVYRSARSIPNFGRMAAFDFTCNLCKCGLNVEEPESMYQTHSTGPLKALNDILILSGVDNAPKSLQVSLGDELLKWFKTNSDIYMLAQVLEDTICNWQKSPKSHIRFFG